MFYCKKLSASSSWVGSWWDHQAKSSSFHLFFNKVLVFFSVSSMEHRFLIITQTHKVWTCPDIDTTLSINDCFLRWYPCTSSVWMDGMGFPKGTLEGLCTMKYTLEDVTLLLWCHPVNPSVQHIPSISELALWYVVRGVILNHMGAIFKLLPSTYCSTKYLSTLNGNVALAMIFQWTAVTFGAFGKPRPVQRVGRSSVTWSTCGCCCCCYVF